MQHMELLNHAKCPSSQFISGKQANLGETSEDCIPFVKDPGFSAASVMCEEKASGGCHALVSHCQCARCHENVVQNPQSLDEACSIPGILTNSGPCFSRVQRREASIIIGCCMRIKRK